MTKKTIKVKKKNGFLEENLGGSLADMMNDNKHDDNKEIEIVDENNTKDVKDDKETTSSLIESMTGNKENKKDKNSNNQKSKLLNSDKLNKLMELTSKINSSDDFVLTDEDKQMLKDELDNEYNSAASELSKIYDRACKDAKEKRIFLSGPEYAKLTKEYYDKIDVYKGSSSNIKSYISSNHDKLKGDELYVLNAQLKFSNSIVTLIDQFINHKIKSICVDEYHNENKIEMIIECLKYIKASDKNANMVTINEDNNIDISKVTLFTSYTEFTKLYTHAKYNDCKDNVKKLSKLIKCLSSGDINIINNFFEDYVCSYLEDLSSREFISKDTLMTAISDTTTDYINDIDNTIKFIDDKLCNRDLDKHLRTILEFVKSTLKETITRVKKLIKELMHRDNLTVGKYIEALKDEAGCPDNVIKPMADILKHFPQDVKCRLVVPDNLSLCGLDENDMLLKIALCKILLESALDDKNLTDNIKLYPELAEHAQLIMMNEDGPLLSIEETIKANKTQIINNIQSKILFN